MIANLNFCQRQKALNKICVADAPSRRKSSKLDIVKSANYIKYIQSRSDSHTVHTLALSFSTLVTPTSEHESK